MYLQKRVCTSESKNKHIRQKSPTPPFVIKVVCVFHFSSQHELICFNDKHCCKDNPEFCFISDSLLLMSSATSTFQGKLLSNISPLMQKKQGSGSVIRWRSTSTMEKYRPPPTTVSSNTSVELAITSLTSSQKMLLV